MKQLMKPLNHIISFFSVKKNNLSILLPHIGNTIESNRKGTPRILYENNEFRFEESTFPRNGTALISSVSNKY